MGFAASKRLAVLALCGLLGFAAWETNGRTWAEADAPTAARADHYGDALPEGVRLRLGRSHTRKNTGVWSLTFSPDSKSLATTHSHTVYHWDVATGKEIRRFTGHTGNLSSLSFAPDGKTLASQAADWTIRLWDVATGKELRCISGFKFTSVTFAPDGKTLAAGSFDKVICLYDATTGQELKRFAGHQNTIRQVVFAPDGKTLASSGDGKHVRLWEVASGKQLREIPQAMSVDRALAFSPDGATLAVRCDGNTVRLLDVASGDEVRRMEKPTGGIWSRLAFSPDGKTLLAGMTDQKYVLWDVPTGKVVRQQIAHRGVVGSAAFAPDGSRFATGSWDETFRLWDAATGKEVHVFPGDLGEIIRIAPAPDGRTIAVRGKEDPLVRVWGGDHPLWAAEVGRAYHGAQVTVSPDGRITLGGPDSQGRLRRWETATGKELEPIAPERGEGFQIIALSADGRWLATGGHDGAVRLREAATGRKVRQFQRQAIGPVDDEDFGPFPGLSSLVFSTDGNCLAAASDFDPVCYVWDVTTGKELRRFGPPDKASPRLHAGWLSAAFSPDGRTVAGVYRRNDRGAKPAKLDVTMQVWELSSARPRLDVAVPHAEVGCVVVAPDGRTLCLGGRDGLIRFRDLRTGKELGSLKGHHGAVTALAFVPATGELLSGGADTTVLLWERGALMWSREAPAAPRELQELEALWKDLGDADAAKACLALTRLATAPDLAVPFLTKRLQAAADVQGERINRLVAELGSDQFAVRQRATDELEKLGDLAEPALKKALAASPSLDMRQRLERLMMLLGAPLTDPDVLRAIRAVEVLEQLATPEARQRLEVLARGAAGAPLTREAQSSLQRLAK